MIDYKTNIKSKHIYDPLWPLFSASFLMEQGHINPVYKRKLQGKPLQEQRVELLDSWLNSAHVYREKGKKEGIPLVK